MLLISVKVHQQCKLRKVFNWALILTIFIKIYLIKGFVSSRTSKILFLVREL